jgi:hypothetical protein
MCLIIYLKSNMNKKAYTLVELLIWILIVSSLILLWFTAFSRVWLWKINLISKTDLDKDAFYFNEKLFQLIKEWWTLDYEEYFNRKIIWTGAENWHYSKLSWFWNYWNNWTVWSTNYWAWYYYCICSIWTDRSSWCISTNNIVWTSTGGIRNRDYLGEQQRYWEYNFQFVDYNSNCDNDFWDENNDGNIMNDDDDEFIWDGPDVFDFWTDVKELYLLSWDKKNRTFIRWNTWVFLGEDNNECNTSNDYLDNCTIWTIQFLRLEWKDWWFDHDSGIVDTDGTQYDWKIDTWVIDSQFTWWVKVIAGSGSIDSYWKELFPDTITVKNFKVYAYPNIDYNYAWKKVDTSTNVSPYVILNYTIEPSWKVKKMLKNTPKEIIINSTINLTEVFSR